VCHVRKTVHESENMTAFRTRISFPRLMFGCVTHILNLEASRSFQKRLEVFDRSKSVKLPLLERSKYISIMFGSFWINPGTATRLHLKIYAWNLRFEI